MYVLEAWHKNMTMLELVEMEEYKLRFIISFDTIDDITVDTMSNVLRRFPWKYFTLVMKAPDENKFKELWERQESKDKDKKINICRFENKTGDHKCEKLDP